MADIMLTGRVLDILSIRDEIQGDDAPYDQSYEGFAVHAFEEASNGAEAVLYLNLVNIKGEDAKSTMAIREAYLQDLMTDIPGLKIR